MPLKLYSLEGRYASALFTAAAKGNELAKVEGDLGRIQSVILRSALVRAFLSDPTLGREKKRALVGQLLSGAPQPYSPAIVNLFSVMAENGRLGLAPKVIAAFEEMMRAHRRQVSVLITSAKVRPCLANDPHL